MGWRGTALLAAALLVATLYTWFDLRRDLPERGSEPRSWIPKPTPPSQDRARLLHFNPDSVTTIHLRRNTVDVQATRADGSWAGVSHPQLLDDFLRNLQDLGAIMPLDVRPDELKEYGLDPPAGVIELLHTGAAPTVILLGDHNPPGTGAYVQLGRAGPVVLTGALMLWEFDKAIRAIENNSP